MTASIVECPSAAEILRSPGKMMTTPMPTSYVRIVGVKTQFMDTEKTMTNPRNQINSSPFLP